MASKVQIRRGTTSDANAFAGGEGELYMDLDQNDLRVHNGTTLGGFRIPNVDFVNEVASNKVDKIQLSSGGTVGSSSEIPVITYNEQGQITVASSASLPNNLATTTYVDTAVSNLIPTIPNLNNLITLKQVNEVFSNVASYSATIEYNFNNGNIFYQTNLTNTFDANFINIPTSDLLVTTCSLIIEHQSNAYVPNNLYINGSLITGVKWLAEPVAVSNTTGIITYTMIRRNSSWNVLASYASYGV